LIPVEVVLFDLGGVVCAFHPDRRLKALSEATGLPERTIHARIWESGLDRALDTGVHDAASAHRALCDALEADLTPDRLAASWARAFDPDLAVLTLVQAVHRRARTGLLTDNGPILLASLPVLFPEVHAAFDWLLFSCTLRATKPSAELFARGLERIAVPPGRVLLVDDSPCNVEGARAHGLQAVVFETVEQLRRDLTSAGVLP
jgi:putative hydrolase of the HAD superfamily